MRLSGVSYSGLVVMSVVIFEAQLVTFSPTVLHIKDHMHIMRMEWKD